MEGVRRSMLQLPRLPSALRYVTANRMSVSRDNTGAVRPIVLMQVEAAARSPDVPLDVKLNNPGEWPPHSKWSLDTLNGKS